MSGSLVQCALEGDTPPIGKALLNRPDSNRFLLTGTDCRITFRPKGLNTWKPWQYLKMEKGQWIDGHFVPLHILNGDEANWGGPLLGDMPTLLQMSIW